VSGDVGLVLICLGTLAASNWVAALTVTAILVFALAYVGVLRGYVAAAFSSLLLTSVVAVASGQALDSPPTGLAAFAGGAFVAAVAAVTLWPTYPTSRIRQAVGDSLVVAARRRDAGQRSTTAGLHATGRDRGLVQLIEDVSRLRFALRWSGDHRDGEVRVFEPAELGAAKVWVAE